MLTSCTSAPLAGMHVQGSSLHLAKACIPMFPMLLQQPQLLPAVKAGRHARAAVCIQGCTYPRQAQQL